MSWNMAPEAISTVVLCIIWVYSRKGNLIPSLKNRLFQASFLTTFGAMTSNILSTLLIYTLSPQTLVLTWLVNLFYFLSTPLMGMAYYSYVLANIYEGEAPIGRYFLFSSIPGLAYVVMVLLNPFSKAIFDISLENGYTQGPWISVTYIIFYVYCVACVVLVALKGKRVAPSIRRILFTFPLIAALVIVIQLIYPHIVLSGSAATCALLLIYLYLQNKQIGIDYLTHLPNRPEFMKMMELYLRHKYTFTVVVFSLREFKTVNDSYGQHNGDRLLFEVSEYLRRESGLHEGEIFRYSGDEFALMIRDTAEPAVSALVERLHCRMAQPWTVEGCTCLLSAGLGLVICPMTSDRMDELINGLEYAVATAKRDTANRNICYCTPQLLERSQRRRHIAELLEQNLKTGGFELHYQPILDVENHSFVKAEALLRMSDPELGPISPAEFIPIAEESGLIIDITYLVLEKACRCIRRLLDHGIPLDGISVNFSALQFAQRDLLPRMLEIIARSDIPSSTLKIELTESILAENDQVVTAVINELHDLGIRIGLDDFGTGYSNLISVLGLPIDTVKLDKSLVWSAMKNERFAIAVQNFARAFRELDMTVLAEGVETEEQSRFVVESGCTLIQGFLYARPMPEAAFEAFLREQRTANVEQ